MLNFTQAITRIVDLSEQTLDHVQAEKFDSAIDDLRHISNTATEAMRQISDMLLMRSKGTAPSQTDTI